MTVIKGYNRLANAGAVAMDIAGALLPCDKFQILFSKYLLIYKYLSTKIATGIESKCQETSTHKKKEMTPSHR